MDPIDNADENAINGDGSPSDMETILGPGYSDNQDPLTSADEGTVNAGGNTGTAPVASGSPANGASYTPPSWVSALQQAGGALNTTATGIINGVAAVSPNAAGQQLAPGQSTNTISASGLSTSTLLIGGLIAVGAIFLLLRK